MEKYVKENVSSDSLPRVIKTKDILLIIAVFILFLATMIWCFWGYFETTITTLGVYATEYDSVVVHQPYTGILTKLYVRSDGEYVQQGQLLAKIYPSADSNIDGKDMQYMIDNSIDIYSDVSGLISEIMVSEWEALNVHTDLMTIAQTDSEKISYVYTLVGVEKTSVIEEGMPVRIEHGDALQNQYGYLTGQIVSVGRTSVDSLDIERKIGSKDETQRLLEDNFEKYPVLIKLDTDESDNLLWSSGKDPGFEIQMCDACEVVFIISQQHPYEVFFSGGSNA